MSTKTIYKRIALVAVTAMGAGVLSVAPANADIVAANVSFSKSGATPAATITAPTTVGTSIVSDLNIITATNAVGAAATTIPVTWTLLDPNGTNVTSSATFANTGLSTGVTSSVFTANTTNVTLAATAAAGTRKVGTITFVPSMSGRYTLRAASAASTAGDVVAAIAIADTTTPHWYVTGAGAVIAASGVGTTTVGAVTGGQAQIRFTTAAKASGDVYNLTSSGVGSIQVVANGTTAPAAIAGIAGATDWTRGARITTSADTNINDVLATVNSTEAGTQTLTFTAISGTTGIPTVVATQVITWGAAPTLSAANSTAFLCAGAVTTCAADVSGGVQAPLTAQTSAANAAASIKVTTANSAGVSLAATQTITATVTGPGTLALSTDNNNVNSQGRALTGVAGNNMIAVFGDGTAGTSTITISQGTTVIATKTVTFYGAVATLTAVQNHRIASSAGALLGAGTAAPTGADIANTPAVVLTAKDALGNAVPGLTITAVSSDTTVMSSGITFAESTAVKGNYNVAVNSVANTSGKTATLTFRVMSGTTVLAATTPLTYTLGGRVASVALALDKSTYTVGEQAKATITVKDSSGNAAFDADHADILTGALASTLSIVKALQFNTTNTIVSSLGGVSTVTFNAPGTSGTTWTISGTTGTGPSSAAEKGKALTASAAVTSGADIAALTTLINSLVAKINALSKLVAKIQKKVKA